MKRIAFTDPTNHPMSWFPVMIPLVALMALTGAVRIGNEVATHHGSGYGTKAAPNTPLYTNHFNSTESVFAKYEKVSEMSTAGQDKAALSLVASVVDNPICMDGDSFHAPELHDFSPTSLMLGLANTLRRRINLVTAQGDIVTAHQYVDALYKIGDHLAKTQTPTINSIKITHDYRSMATQIEASMMPSNGNQGMQYEVTTLRSFWNKQIAPQLGGFPAKDNGPERDLAARLSREYQDEWTRIRAGEV